MFFFESDAQGFMNFSTYLSGSTHTSLLDNFLCSLSLLNKLAPFPSDRFINKIWQNISLSGVHMSWRVHRIPLHFFLKSVNLTCYSFQWRWLLFLKTLYDPHILRAEISPNLNLRRIQGFLKMQCRWSTRSRYSELDQF